MRRLAVSLLLLAAACTPPAAPAPDTRVPAEGATMVRVGGGTVFVMDQGRGPAVVLVNGGGMDLRQWNGVAAELVARGFRVVRYDPPGWGRSSPPTVPYSQAETLLAVLVALDVRRPSLVGVSFGGGVALDFALEHPASVERLVLAAPAVGGFPWSPAFRQRDARSMQAPDSVSPDVTLDDPYFAPSTRRDTVLRRAMRALLAENVGVNHLDWRLMRRPSASAITRLEQVRAPTLVIVPVLDHPDLHAVGDTLARRIPGVRRVEMPGAGHMAHLEQPRRFAGLVAAFLGAR